MPNYKPLQNKRACPPASDREEKEEQIIADAMELAQQRIIDGTASDSLVIQFLKMGSTKEQLEKEKIRADVELASAKVKSIESLDEIEKLYKDAIESMRVYSGRNDGN